MSTEAARRESCLALAFGTFVTSGDKCPDAEIVAGTIIKIADLYDRYVDLGVEHQEDGLGAFIPTDPSGLA